MMAARIVPLPTAFSLSGGKKRKRVEDKEHLEFIRTLPCLVTGKYPVEAAHIRFGDLASGKRETGGQEKPDDKWTIPLSPEEHRKQHSMSELDYWKSNGIDVLTVASKLYMASGDDAAAKLILSSHRPQVTAPMDDKQTVLRELDKNGFGQ